ncbi:endonuclease [Dinoroseobacter sp. PD6]|uniref:endonuclease n=1 Tax=Dinoroseobacter sp. PD6 TaxID=3028384 RepID=UPI00237C3BA3|nr:endonuclease [Dinoroseobacter sp. PD6]MDD9716158.1 endonuclease [Dinoroseobacter sp. PD6]
MATQRKDMTCTITCWGIGVLLGIMTTVGLMVVGWSFLQGAFMGVLAWLIVGGVLAVAVCGETGRPKDNAEQIRAEMAAARERVQGATPGITPKPAPSVPADVRSKVQPSAALAGEAELAGRKGSWSYDSGAGHASGAGHDAGTDAAKPATLTAARDGKADDLKKIKGVGPKLEEMLHSMGFYHFDQVASWSEQELAWVDENLEGFKGRASRDEWVAQAKLLAQGGETEFSKRVDGGDVY